MSWSLMGVKGLNDHLISYNITPESHIKVERIKEINTKSEKLLIVNSPYRQFRKCIKNSMGNMRTDVRV